MRGVTIKVFSVTSPPQKDKGVITEEMVKAAAVTSVAPHFCSVWAAKTNLSLDNCEVQLYSEGHTKLDSSRIYMKHVLSLGHFFCLASLDCFLARLSL